MINKYICILVILIILSCNGKSYKYEYYDNGKIKAKIEINKEGLFDGVCNEYYDTGEMKMKTYYSLSENIDTTYVYYKDGTVRQKGKLKGNLKTNWWLYYNASGDLLKKNEYKIIGDGIYENQSILYDEYGYSIDSLSSFFTVELPDTLKLGKNIGKVRYNSNFHFTTNKYLYVVIENIISENKIRKDTFIEEPNYSRFAVFAQKKGLLKVKGTIIEKLLYKTKIEKDSFLLEIKEHEKYFNKEVYVE